MPGLTPYTRYESLLIHFAKKSNLSFREANRVLCEKSLENTATRTDISESEKKHKALQMMAESHMELNFAEGNVVHLFMPPLDFCNWLVDCYDNTGDTMKTNLKLLDDAVLKPNLPIKLEHTSYGVLHFEGTCGRHSVLFGIYKNMNALRGDNDNEIKELHYQNLQIMHPLNAGKEYGDVQVYVNDEDGKKFIHPKDYNWYAKLILGLGMYINSFPEMLRNGLPANFFKPELRCGINRKINIDPTICFSAEERGEQGPRFCPGHFRFLQSEKYTHKRFQTIFVRAYITKGAAAMTVEGV